MIHTVNNEIKESNSLQNRLKDRVPSLFWENVCLGSKFGKMLFSPIIVSTYTSIFCEYLRANYKVCGPVRMLKIR